MEYRNINKVEITREKIDLYNKYLQIDFDEQDEDDVFDEIGAKKDDSIKVFGFQFENGNEIQIYLCSGNYNYYVNALLVNKDKDFDELDFDLSLENNMQFDFDGDIYICNYEIID